MGFVIQQNASSSLGILQTPDSLADTPLSAFQVYWRLDLQVISHTPHPRMCLSLHCSQWGGGEKRSIISITSPVKIPEKLCWRIWRFLFCQPSRTSAVCSTELVPLWLCKPNKTKVKSEILYSRNWKRGVVKSHRTHQNSVLLWQGQFPRIDVKHRIIF